MSVRGTFSWPKQLPELTQEQQKIRDDFMRHWHEKLGSTNAFKAIEIFNHRYSVVHSAPSFVSTLEIGAGLGAHLEFEKLTPLQRKNYVALELRENMLEQLHKRFPDVQTYLGDCQKRLNFLDNHFDRIVAVHVLEHLPDLPAAAWEIYRLCNKDHGILSVVIPCEGGLAYLLARQISAKRIFEQRYKQKYDWFVDHEHLSVPCEIFQVLEHYFEISHKQYFPFNVPVLDANLCIGITYRPKPREVVSLGGIL